MRYRTDVNSNILIMILLADCLFLSHYFSKASVCVSILPIYPPLPGPLLCRSQHPIVTPGGVCGSQGETIDVRETETKGEREKTFKGFIPTFPPVTGHDPFFNVIL